MLNGGMFPSLQHMEADKCDENAACDAKGRQGDAEKCKNQLPGSTEDHNDDGAYKERLGCDLAPCVVIVVRCETQENGRIGDRIHDGEEAHEDRQCMTCKTFQGASGLGRSQLFKQGLSAAEIQALISG